MSGLTRERAIELENRLKAASKLMVTAIGDMARKAESIESSVETLKADTTEKRSALSHELHSAISAQSGRLDQFTGMRFVDRVRWIVTGKTA